MRILIYIISLFLITQPIFAASYYVDSNCATPGDGSSGTCSDASTDPFDDLSDIPSLSPADIVYLKMDGVWAEAMTVSDSGTVGSVITITNYGSGTNKPQINRLIITGDYITIDGIIIDGGKTATYDLVSPDGDNIIIQNSIIRHGLRDGIDIGSAGPITIQNNEIYLLLNGTCGSEDDAHGITGTATGNILIDNNTIYKVSGDIIQFDDSRNTSGITITVANNHAYTAALTSDEATGFANWNTGEEPGENFIDTKANTSFTMAVSGNVVHGWNSSTCYSSRQRSPYRIKETVVVTINGDEIYDCERGFDISAGTNDTTLTIKNCIIYDMTDDAITIDESITDFKIYNNTFGDGINVFFDDNTDTNTTPDYRNNGFLGTKPAEFTDPSNISASSGDFLDSANDVYTLPSGSSLIGAGDTIESVSVDNAGRSRVIPYESGAYEYYSVIIQNGTIANGAIQ